MAVYVASNMPSATRHVCSGADTCGWKVTWVKDAAVAKWHTRRSSEKRPMPKPALSVVPKAPRTNRILAALPPEEVKRRKRRLHATGLERGSNTVLYAALNALFLREHNRICGLLAAAHPGWDDDRPCPNGLLGADPSGGARAVEIALAHEIARLSGPAAGNIFGAGAFSKMLHPVRSSS